MPPPSRAPCVKADLGVVVAKRYWEDTAAALETMLAETSDPLRCLHQYPDIFRKSLEGENRLCLCSFMAAEYDDLPEAVKKEVQAGWCPIRCRHVEGSNVSASPLETQLRGMVQEFQ